MLYSQRYMALTRRWAYCLALAALFIFLFVVFNPYIDSSSKPASISYYPPVADDGRYHWSRRKPHYPPTSLSSLPSGNARSLPPVQDETISETSDQRQSRLERRNRVQKVFKRCWESYTRKAWMYDELSPISGKGRNSFGGWSATLVDALDTLWIMDMKGEFKAAVEAASNIDFSTSTDEIVNVFETTIRYLGGFLSAYDLSGDRRLLDKAVDVGEMVLVAFDTPNHMPITRWPWKVAKDRLEAQKTPEWMLVSELGSLSLEFTRLSQVTGDARWYDAIARITELFESQQNKTNLPGMWPVVVNPATMDLTGDTGFTLGGMSDSLYEYFPKEYALLGGLEPVYKQLYDGSMNTVTEQMLFRPMTPNNSDILMSGDLKAGSGPAVLDPRGQHLTCFAGGMFGLGGKLFSNPEHVAIGKKLTDGCIWAYQAMPWGVMPEIAHFVPCASKNECQWDEQKWLDEVTKQQSDISASATAPSQIVADQNLPQGFTKIDDKRYILRPEAIESVFIYYRITGDRSYQDRAWEMFTAIENVTATELANAALSDVTTKGTPPAKHDRMESFWLAETLKYFYLIFSEPDLISLDEYVLNTEAHPLKRPK